jgi:putative membrane protein (TIGR04086 family)
MRKVLVLAVFIGGVVSLLTATVLSIPFGIYLAVKADPLHRLSPAEVSAAIQTRLFTDPAIYFGAVALNCLSCILGGYAAALTARRNEALIGLASCLLFFAVQAGILSQGIDPHPRWVQMLQLTGTAVCSWLGGSLRAQWARRTDLLASGAR